MPSRLDRRRFLLAVTTGNPVLIRRTASRDRASSGAADSTESDRSFRSAPLGLPAGIAAVTFTYDGCALKTRPQPEGSGAFGTVVTCTHDPDNSPAPICSITCCYASAVRRVDALSSVITYTYDAAGRPFYRPGEDG